MRRQIGQHARNVVKRPAVAQHKIEHPQKALDQQDHQGDQESHAQRGNDLAQNVAVERGHGLIEPVVPVGCGWLKRLEYLMFAGFPRICRFNRYSSN